MFSERALLRKALVTAKSQEARCPLGDRLVGSMIQQGQGVKHSIKMTLFRDPSGTAIGLPPH